MSPVQNIWRQLIQRRLWPLAIILVVGLAAVPVMLAKEPDPAEAPTAVPATTGNDELATQPIVALAAAEDRAKRRHVLGTAKNPFAVVTPEPVAPTATATPEPSADSTPTDGSPTGTGTTPDPDPDAPAAKTYAMHELTVRFGTADASDLQTLERLQPLPSADAPVLIYLGAVDDGKTAVFLLDQGLIAVGDGKCKPGAEQCETLRMKVGETEFLDVVDETGAVTEQYQLDLIKIHKRTTASASRANASSKAGRRLLKAHGPTGYRWNAAAAALERRPGRTLRAMVAGSTASLR